MRAARLGGRGKVRLGVHQVQNTNRNRVRRLSSYLDSARCVWDMRIDVSMATTVKLVTVL
jgi:hypothetical protein